MSVTSPTLTVTIGTETYRTEIDANFVALQDYCDQVESEFDNLNAIYLPLCAYLPSALPSGTGNINLGIVIPLSCNAISAYARLAVCADGTSATTDVQLRKSGVNIFGTDTWQWENGDDGVVRTITGSSPYTILSAGDYVQVYQTVSDGDWSTAYGLAVTLLIERL